MKIKLFLILNIVIILLTCSKQVEPDVSIEIFQPDIAYKYDDLFVEYSIRSRINQPLFLRFELMDMESKCFDSYYFDTVLLKEIEQGRNNLQNILWNFNNTNYKFHELIEGVSSLKLIAINSQNGYEYSSNVIDVFINGPNPDTNVLDNFLLSDIENNEYELIQQFSMKDYLFLFEFAAKCSWSKKSVPLVKHLDSILDDELHVFAINGVSRNSLDMQEMYNFIEDFKIDYPVFIREDNPILNKILHPDNILSYPRFVLINNERRIVYQDFNNSVDMVDSILSLCN